MKITLKKTFLKDIQKVSEPQKSQVKFFLEELHANPSISESSYNIKKLKEEREFFQNPIRRIQIGI